jgi:hypothetical protein
MTQNADFTSRTEVNNMTKRAVPDFTSLDDMARFFEENSVADLDLQVEPIKYEPKRIVLSVRFDPDDIVGLARLARKYGMDRSTLVRFLVKRFLQQSGRTQDEESGHEHR